MEVGLIVAVTVDGFIARREAEVSTAWTSREDKKWFGEISRKYEIVVMGRKTFETVGQPLPGRVNIVLSRSEIEGAKSLDELMVGDSEGLFVSNLGAQELVAKLEKIGRKKLAVCGGASVYHQFLETDLVDHIYLTIEPIMFGVGVKLIDRELNKKFTLLERIMLSEQTTVLHLGKGDCV